MKKRKIIVFAICAVMVLCLTACDSKDYKAAMTLTENGDWKAAREIFTALGDYEDSAAMVTECDYRLAVDAMEAGQLENAITAFEALGDYEDSADMMTECKYRLAVDAMEAGQLDDAISAFEALGKYEDSTERLNDCRYEKAQTLFDSGDFAAAQELFADLGNYKDCGDMIKECKYQTAVAHYDAGEFEEALNGLMDEDLYGYKESNRYTALTLLQYDQQFFVDVMAAGMNDYFAGANIPMQMTETTASTKHDDRHFNITNIYDTAYVNVTFAPSNGEGTITGDGQINYLSVCADSYNESSLEMVAEQYFLASGVMMATLVDETDIGEFIGLMTEQLDQTVDSSSEYVQSESSAFEYAGYNCRVSITDFGDDIIRLVFSITVPELVEPKA